MTSTCCSKHVEAWNKYIEKECFKLVINQNYVEMHGQQNIKRHWAQYKGQINTGAASNSSLNKGTKKIKTDSKIISLERTQ
jgi:hypothetical protein